MYKVLIADDDKAARDSLSKAVNWEKFDMTIIAFAKNSFESIEAVKKERPDICFINIDTMPIKGFNLIEKINKIKSDTISIMISNYGDFEYALKAVRLRAYDYLLKPVNMHELGKLLKRIKTELDNLISAKSKARIADEIMNENKQALKNLFLKEWLTNDKQEDGIQGKLNYFDVDFQKDAGIILIEINFNYPVDICNIEVDRKILLQEIQKLIMELLPSDSQFVLINNDGGNIVLIVAINNYIEWELMKKALETQMEVRLNHRGKVYSTVAYGGNKNIPYAFKAMRKHINSEQLCLPIIKKIKMYIENNIDNSQLRLQSFARENQMSLSYLSKLFKKETGESFIDYLIRFRITTSLCLLDNSTLKIFKIAEMVGYSSQHYYCEAFKKVMGISPTRYRKWESGTRFADDKMIS